MAHSSQEIHHLMQQIRRLIAVQAKLLTSICRLQIELLLWWTNARHCIQSDDRSSGVRGSSH